MPLPPLLILFFSDLLHALDRTHVADHRLIVHLNNNNIFQPDCEDLALGIVIDEDILTAQIFMRTHALHALLIRGKERAILLPVTHVIPANVGGDYCKPTGLLHDAVIDGDRLDGWPDLVHNRWLPRRACGFHNLIYFLHSFGQVRAQFTQDSLDLPDEHTAIPDVVAIPQIALGGRSVRLFYETLTGESLVSEALADLRSVTNVAIASFWRCRLDAQRYEMPLGSHFLRQAQRLPERLSLGNHMVGRQRDHHSFGILARNSGSDPGNRWRRIAPHWLA